MNGKPIYLPAVAAVRARCARLHLSAQQARSAVVAAIHAMDAGASPALAVAKAHGVIRSFAPVRQPPQGAA